MKPDIKDIIFEWLKEGKSINLFSASYYFDCDNLAKVIFDIQTDMLEDNEIISRTMIRLDNQKEYAEYKLIQ